MRIPTEDYYSLLGVPRNAERAQIRKAYADIVFSCHPDRTAQMPGLDDEQKGERRQKFILATEAYGVLSEKEKRAEYDRELEGATRAPQHPSATPKAAETPGPREAPPKPLPAAEFDWGAVEEMIAEGKYTPLIQMCSNSWRDSGHRTELGIRLVSHFNESGSWSHLCVLVNTYGVPDTVRSEAYGRLPDFLATVDDPGLRHAFIQFTRSSDIEYKVRSSAGLRAVEAYAEKGMWAGLVSIISAYGIPKAVQASAYSRLPDFIAKEGRGVLQKRFLQFTRDGDIDYKVRSSSGLRAVEAYAKKGKWADLLNLILTYGVPEAVQKAAYMRMPSLMHECAPPALQRHFLSLTSGSGFDVKCRISAGLAAVDAYSKHNVFEGLFALATTHGVPPAVQKAASRHLPESFRKSKLQLQKMAMAIQGMVSDRGKDLSTRSRIGLDAVHALEEKGMWAGIMKYMLAREIPEEVRAAAKNALPAALRNSLHSLLASGELEKSLAMVSNPKIPAKLRSSLGVEVVDALVSRGELELLLDHVLSPSAEAPEAAKVAARRKLPSLISRGDVMQSFYDLGRFPKLGMVLSDDSLPPNARMIGGLAAVRFLEGIGRWEELLEWSQNRRLPHEVVKSAEANLQSAMAKSKIAEKPSGEGKAERLVTLSMDGRLNENIRMCMALTAVEIFEKSERFDALFSLSTPSFANVPLQARAAATAGLLRLMAKENPDPEARHDKAAREMAAGLGNGGPGTMKRKAG